MLVDHQWWAVSQALILGQPGDREPMRDLKVEADF